jgi:hypothetical protein
MYGLLRAWRSGRKRPVTIQLPEPTEPLTKSEELASGFMARCLGLRWGADNHLAFMCSCGWLAAQVPELEHAMKAWRALKGLERKGVWRRVGQAKRTHTGLYAPFGWTYDAQTGELAPPDSDRVPEPSAEPSVVAVEAQDVPGASVKPLVELPDQALVADADVDGSTLGGMGTAGDGADGGNISVGWHAEDSKSDRGGSDTAGITPPRPGGPSDLARRGEEVPAEYWERWSNEAAERIRQQTRRAMEATR